MSRTDDEENSTMIRRPANYRKEALKRKFVNIDCFISFCLDCPGKEVDLGGNLVAVSPLLALTITYSWFQELGLSFREKKIDQITRWCVKQVLTLIPKICRSKRFYVIKF